jgi:branched-chain amino acid aminotransferase
MNFINLNGKILSADEPALLVTNRAYRYGDGLFETMKVVNGRLLLKALHFERLFSGISVLKMRATAHLTDESLLNEMLQLCKKNNCEKRARVRLSVFRGNGGLYDEKQSPGYLIEAWPMEPLQDELNENGLAVDIFPDAQKSCDIFSNLKSSSFQLYAMAALYAKENRLNDCFVLNTAGNIADTTIANVFLMKGEKIVTPALSQGCVAGVMRRHVITLLTEQGQPVTETTISPVDLLSADEVFLTNAVKGIRWVKQFRNKVYSNTRTVHIYQLLMKTIVS